MNLEEKSIQELKSIAYDLIAAKEQTERNLSLVNQVIAKKLEEEKKLSELQLKPSED